MPRRTKAEAKQTKTILLEAALRVFHRKGYSRSTLEDIAREAGVTRGAVHWHFKNKADILEHLGTDMYRPFEIMVSNVVSEEKSASGQLHAIMEGWLTLLFQDIELRRTCEVLYYRTEYSDETLPILQAARQSDEQLTQLFKTLIAWGQQTGEIRAGLNVDRLSIAVYSYLIGLFDTWVFEPSMISSPEDVSDFVEIFMKGVKAAD